MYEQLKKRLEEFLSKDEITSDGVRITFYDLRNQIQESLSELFFVLDSNSQADKFNRHNMIKKIEYLSRLNLSGYKTLKMLPLINRVIPSSTIEINSSSIIFGFEENSMYLNFSEINKDYNDNSLFFKKSRYSPLIKEFIKANYKEIMNIFQVLEKFTTTFGYDLGANNDLFYRIQTYHNGFLTASIFVNDENRFSVIIGLHNDEDKKICQTEWFGKENLQDFIYRNQDAFLKRMAIPVESLNPLYQKVIELSRQDKKIRKLSKRNQ